MSSHENPSPEPGLPGKITGGLSAEDLITLNEEIAGMARAGLPLDQGLAALAREMGRGRLQKVTATIAADLQSGFTLPQALERQAERVPPYYAALVTAGIRSGKLGDILSTLTLYARSLADLRIIVVNALVYPTVILVLSFILFGFVFMVVIPGYAQIFHDFKIQLPLMTRVMICISENPLEMFVAPPLAMIIAFFLVRFWLKRQDHINGAWTRFVYAVPIVGTLIRSARLASFTELLGILVDNALPLPEAFGLAGAASSDPIMAGATRQVQEDLHQGQSLGDIMRERKLVPDLIAWMTSLGENRGSLGKALHQVSTLYRRQAELRANLLRSVLPPFLIILTAAFLVAIFVFGVGLPLYQILERFGGNRVFG